MPDNKDANGDSVQMPVYRIFSTALAVLMLGVISWMAFNVADIPVIKNEISFIERNLSDTIALQSSKINNDELRIEEHEKRIQRLEDVSLRSHR